MYFNRIASVLAGALLVCAGADAAARDRVQPLRVVPIETMGIPEADLLSSPSADSPSALNLSIASVYKPITPCRIADTRFIDGGMPFGGGETVGFWGWAGDPPEGGYAAFGGVNASCGIPSTATAIHMNLSIVGSPTAQGFVRAWPNDPDSPGGQDPGATLLVFGPGSGASNAVTVPICSDTTAAASGGADECTGNDPMDIAGTVDFYVKIFGTSENLIIDAVGYYEPLELNTP